MRVGVTQAFWLRRFIIIIVSIAAASAHSVVVDVAITYSFWALAFLMASGIVLATLVW
jgi:hypothetical protein